MADPLLILYTLSQERKFSEMRKMFFDNKLDRVFGQTLPKILNEFQDPFSNSLLFLLLAQAAPMGEIYKAVSFFLQNFDADQISLQINKFIELAENFKDYLSSKKILAKGVKAFQGAVEILNSSEVGLTRIHNIYLQICLQCKMYRQALRVAKEPLTKLSLKYAATHEDVFTFYYYSGLVYLGLKMYNMAMESFSTCLNLQMKDIHPASIESRKKFTLLLLRQNKNVEAKLKELQGSSTSFFQTIIDSRCQPYNDLRKEENLKSIEAWDKQVESTKKDFIADRNMGLCKQARLSLYRKELKDLKKIYTLYTLSDLKTKLQIANDQNLIALIFKLNDIKKIGRINMRLGALEFVKKSEIDYEKDVNVPLEIKFKLMREVTKEFNTEYEVMIKEVTLNPDSFYPFSADKMI